MRRARRVCAAIAIILILLAGASSSIACGKTSAPGPSGAAQAYESVHPSGGLPTTLRPMDLSRDQVGRRVAAIIGEEVRILLPTRLPHGFKPAEPYIAVGDGTARPNPEGWGRNYRVSYTDGSALLIMTCGAVDLPDEVAWTGSGVRLDGRPGRVGHSVDGAWVVATSRGRPQLVMTGWAVERGEILSFSTSLAPWP